MSLPPPPTPITDGPGRWADLVPKPRKPGRPGLVTASAVFLGLGGVLSIWLGIGALGFGGQAQLTPDSLRILNTLAAALLLIGALQVGTGILIFAQRRLGRSIGVVLAAVGMVSAIMRLGVAPTSGLVSVILYALVLYALTTHKGAFGRWH